MGWFNSVARALNIWRYILDSPFIPYILAVVTAAYAFSRNPSWLCWFYTEFSTEFPNPLYTAMGFVITTTAIIIATYDNGRLKIFEDAQNLWQQLIRHLIVTAATSGITATTLIFADHTLIASLEPTVSRAIFSISLSIFIFLILQIGTTIYVLGKIATIPKQVAVEKENLPSPDWTKYEKAPEGPPVDVNNRSSDSTDS